MSEVVVILSPYTHNTGMVNEYTTWFRKAQGNLRCHFCRLQSKIHSEKSDTGRSLTLGHVMEVVPLM